MVARSTQFAVLVAQQPDNEMFRFSLAQALLAEGRTTDALPHLEFCAVKKSEWMMPRIVLGKTLRGLGRNEAARRWLGEALQLAIVQHHETPEQELRELLGEL